MKKVEVRWSRKARTDLIDIWLWIGQDKQDFLTADRWARKLSEAAENLKHHPNMGKRGRRAGRRQLTVEPWVIHYSVVGRILWIWRIDHGKQIR